MIEIKIPAIKVISQNQKMQGRAMFRQGTRAGLKKILDSRIVYGARSVSGEDMAAVFHYLGRQVLAVMYKTRKFKEFERDLKIEILKSLQGKPRPTFTKNINMLISINTYLDIDNPVKGIIDTLAAVGIIENDREIRKLKIIKTPSKRGSIESIIIKIEGETA